MMPKPIVHPFLLLLSYTLRFPYLLLSPTCFPCPTYMLRKWISPHSFPSCKYHIFLHILSLFLSPVLFLYHYTFLSFLLM
jgi:hypothetical protein